MYYYHFTNFLKAVDGQLYIYKLKHKLVQGFTININYLKSIAFSNFQNPVFSSPHLIQFCRPYMLKSAYV